MNKTSKIVAPFVISIILTPFFLVLAFISAGFGHGDNFWGYILFPYTMALRGAGAMTPSLETLSFVQFPLYGLIVGITRCFDKLPYPVLISISVLAIIHGLMICHHF